MSSSFGVASSSFCWGVVFISNQQKPSLAIGMLWRTECRSKQHSVMSARPVPLSCIGCVLFWYSERGEVAEMWRGLVFLTWINTRRRRGFRHSVVQGQ